MQIEYELELICELKFEHYFLTVADIVAFARSRHILCQGRGSAANSVICYCIGVTEVDPARMSVLFERFISRELNEPPDIDIDFAARAPRGSAAVSVRGAHDACAAQGRQGADCALKGFAGG